MLDMLKKKHVAVANIFLFIILLLMLTHRKDKDHTLYLKKNLDRTLVQVFLINFILGR